MFWETIFISPCCKAQCVKIKDKLAGRSIMQCSKCRKLVSKSRCARQAIPHY